MMKSGSKLVAFILLVFLSAPLLGQITSAHIIYERKTNLYKKFKNDNPQDWIAEADRNKVDTLELYCNDSLSYFCPKENDLKEKMSWATLKNKVYINHNTSSVYSIKEIWEEETHILDTLRHRTWKIIPGKRKICGYECQKALWSSGDTLNIYAWFATELTPSSGPETFGGLPGTILGLATEDGGVVYFARQVLLERIDVNMLQPKKYKGKVFEPKELKAKLEKDFGKMSWGRLMIAELFGIW